MAVETWIYQYHVAAPHQKVYEYLSQAENYLKLSPLIVKISDVQETVDSDGRKQSHYKSVERFKFLGFMHWDNPIDVTMTFTEPGKQLVCDVQARMGVSVQFVYDLSPQANETQITETITARMPAWSHRFVVGQAKMVQQFRAKTLNAELSSR